MLEIRNMTRDLNHPKYSPWALDLELPPWIDIVAFSLTDWEDAHERPRRLMTRCAKSHRVFFFQEPEYDACGDPFLELAIKDRVNIVIPHLRRPDSASEKNKEKMIGLLLSLAEIHDYIFWYFSPFAVEYTRAFSPRCKVYDCMNELPNLRNTIPDLYEISRQKLSSFADLIFTTDLSMCLDPCFAKRNVHLFTDSKHPKVADWDALWRQMSRLIHRTFKGVHPYGKTIDPRT